MSPFLPQNSFISKAKHLLNTLDNAKKHSVLPMIIGDFVRSVVFKSTRPPNANSYDFEMEVPEFAKASWVQFLYSNIYYILDINTRAANRILSPANEYNISGLAGRPD